MKKEIGYESSIWFSVYPPWKRVHGNFVLQNYIRKNLLITDLCTTNTQLLALPLPILTYVISILYLLRESYLKCNLKYFTLKSTYSLKKLLKIAKIAVELTLDEEIYYYTVSGLAVMQCSSRVT